MHKKQIEYGGKDLEKAKKVLIMLHGRGASAQDIMGLAPHLEIKDFALIAPQATNHTWYPYSFLAPPQENEPWLTSALKIIKEILDDLKVKGFSSEDIYLLGFSQGACLCLEFAARNAQKFGGIAAFTGGLIGDKVYTENYSGDFQNTPIFIGTGDPDAHVPVNRVNDSAEILRKMNAEVYVDIYPNRPHTISQEEIDKARKLIFKNL